MLTLFSDERGVILEHYLPKEEHSPLPPELIMLGILCEPQSNANDADFWAKVSFRNMTMLDTILPVQRLQTSRTVPCLPRPPYSPDFAPKCFHLFGRLKEAMGRKTVRADEEVQRAVYEWLQMQLREFFFPTWIQGLYRMSDIEHNVTTSNKLYLQQTIQTY